MARSSRSASSTPKRRVAPAFGYRIDFRGRSVVISGDTKPSDNLVTFATGVDLLIHEVSRSKQDPLLAGPPEDPMPNSWQTRRQARTIADHHTDGTEAGQVLQRVKSKLAVFSHYRVDPPGDVVAGQTELHGAG